MEGRKKCLSILLVLLLLVQLAVVPSLAAEPTLEPPTLQAEATSDTVTLRIVPSSVTPEAQLQFSMSRDSVIWNSWKTDPVFTGLTPETTYYFRARYVTDSATSAVAAITVTTLEYVAPAVPQLTAPKLSDAQYVVKNNEIQVRAVDASTEEPQATAMYRISTDQENWSAWQSSHRFTGLNGGTNYYFQAMYQAFDKELWADSQLSNTVHFRTLNDGVAVTLRVIGTTMPTERILFSSDAVDYKDGVHQNWIQTSAYEGLNNDTKVFDFVSEVLTENGFVVSIDAAHTTSITAPDLFGGQTLTYKGYRDSRDSGWMYVVYDSNGKLTRNGYDFVLDPTTLKDGDTVIVYYAFDSSKETIGKNSIYAGAWLTCTPDASLKDYELAYGIEELIDQIGSVTGSSGGRIETARTAYDALTDMQKSLVRNYDTLTDAESYFETISGTITLVAPKLRTQAGVTANVVSLSVEENVTVDPSAMLQYRMSKDGVHWLDWQESSVFKQLRSSTTYYFQARWWPGDVVKYVESAPSETLTVTTAKAAEYSASTRNELVSLISGAPTDGTEIVINIISDIEIGLVGSFTPVTPGGSNITIVGAGGKLLSPSGGQMNNGICVGNSATLTLRNLEYNSIGPWGVAYGIEQQTGNANFGSMIYMGGSDCTVNLENATLYGDCMQAGAIITNGTSDSKSYDNNTVNIYSGTLDQLNGGSGGDITGRNKCVLIAGKGIRVNLRPAGDIVLEGVIPFDNVRLIPEPEHTIQAASVLSADFSDYTDLSADLEAMNAATEQQPYKVALNPCGGLRIETSGSGYAMPIKLAAPNVTNEDFVVDKATVTVPSELYHTEDADAVLQYRVYDLSEEEPRLVLPYDKWMTRPLTFEIELEEDTEYLFELRFNAIGGDFCNSDKTQISIRTGFTSAVLTAPRLITASNKTINTITLAAPKASAQDSKATVEYRISLDGQNWTEQWQTSPTFEGLDAGTVYYFQARYIPDSYLWIVSETSNTLEVMTKTRNLTAPTLQIDSRTANTVTLKAPISTEDSAALVEYRMAETSAALAEANWQSNPVFAGLQSETTYYFQARFVSQSGDWLNSDPGDVLAVATSATEHQPTLTVSNESGKLGETVSVTINMANNPGIAMAKLLVCYDSSRLELQKLVSEDVGTVMSGAVPGPIAGDNWSVILYTGDSRNSTANGCLLTLRFKIRNTSTAGQIPVTLYYETGDIYNEDDQDVRVSIEHGSVTVSSDLNFGDVNGDTVINIKDVTALTRYLAGWPEEIFGAAADVNADGTLSTLDLVILRRHLAGWNGYKTLPFGSEGGIAA